MAPKTRWKGKVGVGVPLFRAGLARQKGGRSRSKTMKGKRAIPLACPCLIRPRSSPQRAPSWRALPPQTPFIGRHCFLCRVFHPRLKAPLSESFLFIESINNSSPLNTRRDLDSFNTAHRPRQIPRKPLPAPWRAPVFPLMEAAIDHCSSPPPPYARCLLDK